MRYSGIAALLALSLSSNAASVTGTFLEARAKTPLVAVEVVFRRAADSTVVAHATTGADGRFRVPGLVPGRYRMRASLLGYEPFLREELNLTADQELGTMLLTVSPIALKGIDVNTARATAIVAPDRNIYLTKDMPAATTGTATDVLRAVPELDVDIDGHVSLRGSTGVNLQFNGRAAPLKGENLTTYLRQMPASRIERVEVIANPSAKFDPEGTAGIVNLVLKDNASLGLSGSVNLSAGQRYNSSGARVAWQQGPLTLFGGVSGSLYRYLYDSNTARLGFLASPPSSFTWDTDGRYTGRFGVLDASIDYALSKRATLYGTINGTLGGSDPHSLTRYALADSSLAVTRSYERRDDGRWDNRSSYLTLGFQHVVQKGKNERSVEFVQRGTVGDSRNDARQHTFVPVDSVDLVSRQGGATGERERSLQVDDAHPIGARGKLELGYAGTERLSTSSSELRFLAGAGMPDVSDYRHRELRHSGYVTAGSTFGRLSLQGGIRAEYAHTTFDVPTSGDQFDREQRTVFPSGNAAWDFGRGRLLRLAYSKRIERPSAYYLNPDVPATDSLNRFRGNPALRPRDTHSLSLDASWTGTKLTLRLSPYLRNTVDNWDLVTEVDDRGVATTTWRNVSSVRVFGVSLTASMRQTGRLGGTVSVGVSSERHDASNLSSLFRRKVTGWTANGNVSYKLTSALDLQLYLRYSPARTLAQGRASSYTGSTLSTRVKLGKSAWASIGVNDPFNLSNYWSSTGDATYAQVSTSHNRMRSVSGGLTWTWGKQPEEKQRRQAADAPQPEAPGGVRP